MATAPNDADDTVPPLDETLELVSQCCASILDELRKLEAVEEVIVQQKALEKTVDTTCRTGNDVLAAWTTLSTKIENEVIARQRLEGLEEKLAEIDAAKNAAKKKEASSNEKLTALEQTIQELRDQLKDIKKREEEAIKSIKNAAMFLELQLSLYETITGIEFSDRTDALAGTIVGAKTGALPFELPLPAGPQAPAVRVKNANRLWALIEQQVD